MQARRHVLKTGPAVVRANVGRGKSTRGGITPLVRGVRGISLRENFLNYGCLYVPFKCILDAFWARISDVMGLFGTGGTCISIIEH